MADIGRKRKAVRTLEDAAKRMRIEVATSYGKDSADDREDEDAYFVGKDSEDLSDGEESPIADTPLTPFSPPRKFPSELKTIRCTYNGCTKSFNRPARLRSHLRSHTNERPFSCSYHGCPKTYMEEKHLKQHIKGSHTHEKSYQCHWAGCTKSFLTATRLRRHREAHEGHERYRCTAYLPCNQTFRKHQTLQRHIRVDHHGADPFSCSHIDPDNNIVCNAGFDTAGALRKHEDRAHGALRFWCDECSSGDIDRDGVAPETSFRTQNELMKHVRTNHSDCIFCDMKCSNQAELQKHIETQHSSGTVSEFKSRTSERNPIPCTQLGCGKTFTKKYNLQVHIRTIHNGERFICSSSALPTFKSPELIAWTGEKSCGKDFVTKANLEDHIRTQHLKLPSVVNAKRIKGSKTTKKSKMDAERIIDDLETIERLTGVNYTQDETRNIPCVAAGCPWRFTRQYDLDQHIKSKHKNSISDPDIDDAIENATAAALQVASGPFDANTNNRSILDSMYDQAAADWEWEMENSASATRGGRGIDQFWIGSLDHREEEDDGMSADSDGDEWMRDEEEMRKLIGRVETFSAESSLIDPALHGL